MKKANVVVGNTYLVRVSGSMARVKLLNESPYGGWDGLNLATKRKVRLKTAARLRQDLSAETQKEGHAS